MAHGEGETNPGHPGRPVEDDDNIGSKTGEEQMQDTSIELKYAKEVEGCDGQGVEVSRGSGREASVERGEWVGGEEAEDDFQLVGGYGQELGWTAEEEVDHPVRCCCSRAVDLDG